MSVSVVTYVAASFTAIRQAGGYHKADAAMPTSQLAWEIATRRASEITQADSDLASIAIADLASERNPNDFTAKMQDACQARNVARPNGLLAYVAENHNRQIKRAAEQAIIAAQPKSGAYVGSIGQRLTVRAILTSRRIVNTKMGDSFLVATWLDSDGNCYVWLTNPDMQVGNVGDTAEITGTLKKHSEFNGVLQNGLNRVKIRAIAA